ncbi:hypothetical protein BGZ80_006522 [Entomortierella chlamydospora]|uniref:Uncharacterized protein n=1 Tax=Entomortierella chlamydospora TaxID=101097 RepID=A0A9P6T1W9_9FUNG|nr:hypothetical protein BGZ79_004289 [Entomortierella chlamydospora]KAG0018949.1 hypothetical protein BGZ80_006522 [Entomortierella chlamydospora]
MRTATFFAFFLAMFALICSAVSAETSLEPRATKDVGAAFEGTLDLLVKEHSDIVLKAYADVCTDADLSTAISSNLRVQISGLINFDFGLGSKFSSALHASVKAAVKKEVDAHIKAEFSANLRVNMAAIITKRCPNHDAACIKLEAKFIVKDAVKLTTKASAKISDKISSKLAVKIKSAIDIEVKKFSINLLLIKINVSGDLDVSDSVSLRFKSAAGLCAQACIDISAKEISKIKTICSA